MLQIYKASAGSGKTYTLAKEYVKLVLGYKGTDGRYHLRKRGDYGFGKPKAHGQILAVTFTNKATEEMTARIVKELAVLAHPLLFSDKKSPYLGEFMEAFEASEQEIAEAAKRSLHDLLFNFNSFNVSTIDSFFQGVLRIFTRELELPDDFELQLDNHYPVAVAVGEMLQSINSRGLPARSDDHQRRWLMEWLQNYVMQKVDEGGTFNIFSRSSSLHDEVISIIELLINEDYKGFAPELDEYFADPERLIRFEQGIKKGVVDRHATVRREAAELLDSTPGGVFTSHFTKLLQAWSAEAMPSTLGTTAQTCAEKPAAATLAAAQKKRLVDEALLGRIARVAEAICDLHKRAALTRLIGAQIYLLGLFGRSIDFIREFCKENNLFLLSDTNDLLRDIINEEETPFIYERIGTQIRHFLVDEFQDTSKMQWDNMQPLFMESLSHSNDNLVIGDEKQCIYRFRNSMPEILGYQVEETVAERFGADAVEVKGARLSQNSNYRSATEIVRFNNSLFHALPKVADACAGDPKTRAADTYANIVQKVPEHHADFHGYVKLHFVPTSAPEAGDDTTQTETLVGDEYALNRMVEEIDRQLRSGYSPSDIAILVRSHEEGRQAIARLLRAMNEPEWSHGHIRILSNDALSIGTSSTVRLIVSILRLLVTPQYVHSNRPGEEDKVVLNPAFQRARLLNHYQVRLYDMVDDTDDQGHPLRRRVSPSEALARALADDAEDEIQQKIDELLDMDCPNLISITERIIDRHVPQESKEQDMAFITAFQDLVVDYSQRGNTDIRSFLDWWDRSGRHVGLPSPAGIDAITVSTIHQSKGLQYGCVHLPFASMGMVSYHSAFRKSYGWYPLSAADFPEVDAADVPPFLPLTNTQNLSNFDIFKEKITDFAQQQRIDALNVAYVAFTRAVHELVVYTKPVPKKEGSRDNLGAYIADAFAMMTDDYLRSDRSGLDAERLAFVHPLAVGKVEPGGFVEFGQPTSNSLKAAKKEPQEPSADGHLRSYRSFETEVLTLAKADIRKPHIDMADPRDRGIFLHAVLANVRSLADLPVAFARTAYRFRLTREQSDENLEMLRKALSDSRVRCWFEGFERVALERSLSFPDGVKRPDRVVWLPDGSIAIIDYKFGEADLEKYRRQVREYASLLRACKGVDKHAPIHTYLWHPTSGNIEQVS